MITLDHLTYFYSKAPKAAISDASARIEPGIYLMLGENGAGKTTMLHLIGGLLTPTSGNVEIDGLAPSARQPELMSEVVYVGEDSIIPTKTIRELVDTHAIFFNSFSQEAFEENLRLFNLTGNEIYRTLSLGNRRKSYLAYALALKTKVVLLDEPANGLDITSKQVLQQMLAGGITEEQTVIISTHTTSDFEYLYDGVIAISHSELLLSMPTWRLSELLSFSSGLLPPPRPLFVEQRTGLFRAISANSGEADGRVDFTLLYNALLSPSREAILNHITAKTGETK